MSSSISQLGEARRLVGPSTAIGNGITLSPTLHVAYVQEFAPYRSQIGTLADLSGSTFLIDGARPARNAAQVKAGAEMTIGPRSVTLADFDGEFSGMNQLYAGRAASGAFGSGGQRR